MDGYIYITGSGADPAERDNLSDPLFGKTPTLGACMPNIRRVVRPGDYIFVVSAKIPTVQQYVIGGIRVAEKIDALAAYHRFPENQLHVDGEGKLRGNIIVTPEGTQHPLDHHRPATFEQQIKNFVVGDQSVVLDKEQEVALGRAQSLEKLSAVIGKRGNRVFDIIGRSAKLQDAQVRELLDWLRGIKVAGAGP